jgi:hypothetical protein
MCFGSNVSCGIWIFAPQNQGLGFTPKTHAKKEKHKCSCFQDDSDLENFPTLQISLEFDLSLPSSTPLAFGIAKTLQTEMVHAISALGVSVKKAICTRYQE